VNIGAKVKYLTDAISLAHQATQNIRLLYTSSSIILASVVDRNDVFTFVLAQDVELQQEARTGSRQFSVRQQIDITQSESSDFNTTLGRSVSSNIVLSDAASLSPEQGRPVIDAITLTSVATHGLPTRVVTDPITVRHSVSTPFTRAITQQIPLTSVVTGPNHITISIVEPISLVSTLRIGGGPVVRSITQNINFTDTVRTGWESKTFSLSHIIAWTGEGVSRGSTERIEDPITLTQNVEWGTWNALEQRIQWSEVLMAEWGPGWKHIVDLSQWVDTERGSGRGDDEVEIEDVATWVLERAPANAPCTSSQAWISLVCGELLLVLHPPRFNNSISLNQVRVGRDTLYGDFRVANLGYDTEVLDMRLKLTSETQKAEFLSFLDATRGKEVTLTDQYSRRWVGIITGFDSPLRQLRNCLWEFDLAFEGDRQ
jgi:hypothetical protein